MAELQELKATVKDALLEVRRIIYDLRPMALTISVNTDVEKVFVASY